jgi:DNA-binding NarL/FixJ family response regulator
MNSPHAAIVLTTYEGDALVMRAMKAGAAGYLLKSAARHEMLETLRAFLRPAPCAAAADPGRGTPDARR